MKDFKKWNEKKEKIHANESEHFFYEREIWWCSIGANVGREEDGKGGKFNRPVIIFKKFNQDVLLALPITTSVKSGKYYFPINLPDSIRRSVILSQIRLIDAKRLNDKLGMVSVKEFEEMKKAFIRIIQ